MPVITHHKPWVLTINQILRMVQFSFSWYFTYSLFSKSVDILIFTGTTLRPHTPLTPHGWSWSGYLNYLSSNMIIICSALIKPSLEVRGEWSCEVVQWVGGEIITTLSNYCKSLKTVRIFLQKWFLLSNLTENLSM